MTTQVNNKPATRNTPKPAQPKLATTQEKAVNQLRQEIKNLAKSFNDMQQKRDTQAVIAIIPSELLLKANAYLVEVSKDMGYAVTLSDLIRDAIDVYLWGEEENKRLEEEREIKNLDKE